ncbi:Flp family type IVb pilin [Enteractinococcus helveticum]|uniref:Pilus assembly protein n=1 Tax=Enteractinococcus helveticum TaxID=1837282 RepID=A0A1B7M2Q4_9MICC|nr:Flp family type IVb pilin [Enteractinococcus helveticum]OAV62878.1 pilus assembly protein [Enteractinococcus helveticum]
MLRIYTLIATLQTFVNDRFEGRKDRGATAVEYGLLVGLIAVVIIGAVLTLGGQLEGLFESVSKVLPGAGSGAATDN